MANTIKHKRGSGSNPSANDLVAGEIAIRTDTGVLFIKKDDNSVASISGGSTNLGVSTTSSAVTVTSSTGNNATISEASSNAAGVMSTAHHDKLDGIEANATADQSASEILTAIKTVDGSGSGLDADLVDGIQAGSFLRSDANDNASGLITLNGAVSSGSAAKLQINGFQRTGPIMLAQGNTDTTTFNTTNERWILNNGSHIYASTSANSYNNKIWTDGNDGASSGLDADLLDGVQGSSFLRSDAADTKTSGHLTFNDNVKAQFGGSGDLQIYHDASNSYIADTGAGNLFIRANAQLVLESNNGENYLAANENGDVHLYYDGGVRFSTTSSGISVTGNVVVSGTVDGRDVASDGSKLDGIEANATADQSASEILTAIKTVDGASSGLDADLLDGQHGSHYLNYNNFTNTPTIPTNNNQLTNGAGYITATLTNEQVQDIVGGMLSGNTESGITVTYQDGDGTIDFSVASQTDNNFTTTLKNKLDGIAAGAQVNVATNLSKSTTTTTNVIASSTGTNVTLNEATGSAAGLMSTTHHNKLDGIESGATADQSASEILTAIKTVDGASSGLDADLLDGSHGSAYLDYNNFTNTPTIPTNNNQLSNGAGYITSADGGNAATLDGIDSSQFLRSDAADTKTSGNLTFNDNIKLQLGSSSDLQIYHNGSNSFIDDAGTGGLYIRSNQTQISKYTGETCAKFSADGSVELYYDNSLKVNTTSSGIDVSGIVDIDSHVRHNGDGNTYFGFNGNDQINFYTNGNERFKIDSNGHMYFGQSATSIPGLGNTTTGASFEKLSSGGAFFSSRADGPGLFVNRNNDGDVIQFYRSGNGKGSISVNNNGSNFNNGSDYRLKENIVDLSGAITRLKQLQPKCFNFIDDPDATQVDGFIAHEAATVLPWAITGTHNQVQLWGDYETDELPEGVSVGDPKLDDDGNTIPVMQGMDYGKVTPLLTAALQEAIAKIEALETQNADLLARITALEGS